MSAGRLRREDGFTLTELMVAASVGTIILLAAFALVDTTLRRSTEIQQRVEATAEGRRALDEVVRALRSAVCVAPGRPIVDAGSTATSIVFHSDLGPGGPTDLPQRRTIALDAQGRLTEATVQGTSQSGTTVFTQAPVPRTLLEAAAPTAAGAPVFRYFAFDTATPPRPSVELAAPLTAASAPGVARVVLAFRVQSRAGASTRPAVAFDHQVYMRVANPSDPVPSPACT